MTPDVRSGADLTDLSVQAATAEGRASSMGTLKNRSGLMAAAMRLQDVRHPELLAAVQRKAGNAAAVALLGRAPVQRDGLFPSRQCMAGVMWSNISANAHCSTRTNIRRLEVFADG